MLCPSCGATLSDDAKFCGACGAKLSPPEGEATASSAAVPSSQSTVPPSAPLPQKGVLGQAWTDITSSPGWVKRVLLLMVMNVVPVLNLFVTGYLLQWGADASRGIHRTLPTARFDLRCFLTGLFYLIMSLLMTVASIWTGMLAIIPVLGWIAMAVIPLFANAFLAMAGMRMALFGRFGAAFELSDLFAKYKRSLGSLFAATFVPNLIVVVVVLALVCILMFGSCSAGSGIMDMIMSGPSGSRSNGDIMGMLMMGTGVGLLFVMIIVVFAVFFAGFAQVWSMRAVGIWAARVAPEWQEQAANEQALSGGSGPTYGGESEACRG